MSDDSAAEDRLHRRGFFTHGFRHLLRPLANLVEQRMAGLDLDLRDEPRPAAAGREGNYGHAAPYPAGGAVTASWAKRLLRPPGALPEAEFLARCTSCGRCAAVCPVRAIHLAPNDDPQLNRKPVIDPSVQACVVCDDLSCMKACPTGALQLVPREEIRMGLAVLHRETCVRSRGEDCQICVDKCPIGPTAITIPAPGADVLVKDACTGCGVCEMYCPTEPKAIVIELTPTRR